MTCEVVHSSLGVCTKGIIDVSGKQNWGITALKGKDCILDNVRVRFFPCGRSD